MSASECSREQEEKGRHFTDDVHLDEDRDLIMNAQVGECLESESECLSQ